MDGVTLRPKSAMEEMSAKERAELLNDESAKVHVMRVAAKHWQSIGEAAAKH